MKHLRIAICMYVIVTAYYWWFRILRAAGYEDIYSQFQLMIFELSGIDTMLDGIIKDIKNQQQ